MKLIATQKHERYSATGLVLGNLWGGGQGGYSAKSLTAYSTKEELIKDATAMLNDGSLDSGMGFESLIGARLTISKRTTLVIDGKNFVHSEMETEFIGDLKENEIDFLENVNICHG